jgi:hypothetical protein
MKQSHTTLLERNTEWSGQFETEPYEAGWASEALFFARVLSSEGDWFDADAEVQISPDGTHWANEWSSMSLDPDGGTTYCRVSHFGNWLRLVGELPEGVAAKVLVYLVLKE